ARHAEFATMERRVERRGGRMYLDTGQTGASRTIVAPYSVRARPSATVSTPLFPHEVSAALSPERFTMLTVPSRIAEFGDPFEALFEASVDVAAALGKLERWVPRG
ncbi:MAG TPA: hypothetical protein VFQ61_23980, partial [Polyangiaceae bacterium]|nr:hypothetical protein [Polyangiaceae bacterium]